MILKIKLDKKPSVGDCIVHDDASPIIVCVENKDFPLCDFKFFEEQKVIETKLFSPGMSYFKVFDIILEKYQSKFNFEKSIEFVIQK